MTFNLLTSLNESVKQLNQDTQLIETAIVQLFGEEAAHTIDQCNAVWNNAQDSNRESTVVEAGLDRHAEHEWYKQVADETKKREEIKSKSLGIKQKGTPAVGNIVIMQGGMGKIVDVDKKDNQLMIQNKSGQEKVFKFNDLAGPKKHQGKMVWALKKDFS